MKRELTQEGLARKADIPYTTLAKVESGVIQNPSIETVRKLAVGLEITIDELIS
jgi:transcriptional regulator with XRE-family HTH domain